MTVNKPFGHRIPALCKHRSVEKCLQLRIGNLHFFGEEKPLSIVKLNGVIFSACYC